MRKRHQYRILATAFVFALVGIAFFGAYHGHRPNIASGHESKHFPDFFSREYFIEDPTSFWTLVLAVATFALFSITVWMARATDKVANQSVKTLIATERPYITGGGTWLPGPRGRQFVVDVKNNGKTPALLTHFFIEFAIKAQLPPVCTENLIHIH